MSVDAIQAIKHPVGGGEAPAVTLTQKGYLTTDGQNFMLSQKAKDFLALDVKPDVESAGGDGEVVE